MSNTDSLKKKAAEYENRKQYEKALELYEQVLNHARTGDEDRDVPLYNRVGDLHYRIGNNEQAIGYYEKAADLYAEGGFFNNAIALCNKILRYSPGRTVIYYKLGIINAKKGFNSDAKQNFLEYADRMQQFGKMEEAFRALKEFADLCPGQDDVRLMLADQLARADRKPEALEQLQLLYDTLEAEGRTSEAAAAVGRMKTIDPTFLPTRSAAQPQRKKDGLVFGDLDLETGPHVEHAPEADIGRKPAPAAPEFVSNGAPPEYDPDDEFVDLGDWLERNRTPSSTRMVAHDEEPENDEQKDFSEMLDKFKEGISRNVDDADFESHYELGIAFREMGLLDEAIGCFQKASRGEAQRLRASEAMGQCFIDKDEPAVAMTVLERLTGDSKLDDGQLVGMLYLLGRAAESLDRPAQAASCYQRVVAVHIGFRDAGDRLSALPQTPR
ncbi:MAG: tetratricopeptide repeat protein [Gemmatimonadaceae bacterium]